MPDYLGKDQRKTKDEPEDDDKPIQGRICVSRPKKMGNEVAHCVRLEWFAFLWYWGTGFKVPAALIIYLAIYACICDNQWHIYS